MSEKKRVLFVTQELNPYIALSEISKITRDLPKYIYEQGLDIRVLMPRFGTINERRHKLHEVVRLSGININIKDEDYPLIIKVASLPSARLQVYFLDNEEFFKRKAVFGDAENEFFHDNYERMVFFCKGVIETVKKFGWSPDIVHCHGWMTSLVPMLMKTVHKNEPVFQNSSVVYTVYNNKFEAPIAEGFETKAKEIQKNLTEEELKVYGNGNGEYLQVGALQYSDAVIVPNPEINGEIRNTLSNFERPIIECNGVEDENFFEENHKLYQQLFKDEE